MNTKNLPIIIGIALPLIFVVVISLVISLPSVNIHPQHNFIYTTQSQYYDYLNQYKNNYKVTNGQLVKEPVVLLDNLPPAKVTYRADAPPLYIYDVNTDTSHEISFEDAQKLSLDAGPSSDDGYSVGYEYSNDGIFELFGSSRNSTGFFVSKGNAHKKLNISNTNYYQGNFKFIGWVNLNLLSE